MYDAPPVCQPGRPIRRLLVFFTLLFLAIYGSGCMTFQHPKDHWIAPDKAGHFISFGLMGAAAAAAAEHNGRSDAQTFFIGVGTATGLGAVKEWVDEKPLGKYFSGKDLVFDFLGGVVGSLIVLGAE